MAGLVIARQRPGTANGTMFLLFEDEFGTINLIVAKEVYERHRHLARAEPLLLARGRLERTQERIEGARVWDMRERAKVGEGEEEIRPVVNVIVRELAPLDRFLDGEVDEGAPRAGASVHSLPIGERGLPDGYGGHVGAEKFAAGHAALSGRDRSLSQRHHGANDIADEPAGGGESA